MTTTSATPAYFRHRYPDGHLGWFVVDYKLSKALLFGPAVQRASAAIARGRRRLPGGDVGAGRVPAICREATRRTIRACVVPRHATSPSSAWVSTEPRSRRSSICAWTRWRRTARPSTSSRRSRRQSRRWCSATCWGAAGGPGEVRGWTAILTVGTRTTAAEKKAANREFYAYVREVAAEKRARPSDDLLTELVNGGELSDDELAGTTQFLFAAGHGTVLMNLALDVLFLLSDRERWEAARADLSSIGRTVEELLRLLSPVPTMTRTATGDIELEDGT